MVRKPDQASKTGFSRLYLFAPKGGDFGLAHGGDKVSGAVVFIGTQGRTGFEDRALNHGFGRFAFRCSRGVGDFDDEPLAVLPQGMAEESQLRLRTDGEQHLLQTGP